MTGPSASRPQRRYSRIAARSARNREAFSSRLSGESGGVGPIPSPNSTRPGASRCSTHISSTERRAELVARIFTPAPTAMRVVIAAR
jgi:hypothetical protein